MERLVEDSSCSPDLTWLRWNPEDVAVDLDDLVHSAVRRAAARHTASIAMPSLHPVQLAVDHQMLEQVLDNLLDNAARHAAARSRSDGGAGLGLAIVQDVVTAHGGTVHLTDSPMGGARLVVRLPVNGDTDIRPPPAGSSPGPSLLRRLVGG